MQQALRIDVHYQVLMFEFPILSAELFPNVSIYSASPYHHKLQITK